MVILEEYLKTLTGNHLDNLLSDYQNVIIYDTDKDIKTGLLRYSHSPVNTAFLFKMPKEKVLTFHTVGMKFPIKIFFFNSKKEIVYSYGEVSPGIDHITSKRPAKYVVEIPINE